VRTPPLLPRLALLGLAACASSADSSTLPSGWRPTNAVVLALEPGSVFACELAPGLPDEPEWRAAAIWWREALRQSAAFELREGASTRGVPFTLQLAIDPARRSVAAFLLQDGAEKPLGGDAFTEGELPAAIDRLAWAARTALGERATAPVPVAACVSPEPVVVIAVDDAGALLRDGVIGTAHRVLREARRRDGSSPAVLDGIASVELMLGNPADAEKVSLEALGYTHRLCPTTEHRLARTLQLARASRNPENARRYDRELLALAETGRRERPYDPQIALSEAIARNFLGEFAQSRPLLEQLRQRLPDQAIVSYHLGWACLGSGDGPGAVRSFEDAAVRLPMPWVAVPQAIARYTAGDNDGLRDLLARCLREGGDDAPFAHDIRRMQAAHAILRSRFEEARELMLQDFHWLLRNPSVIDRRAGEFAEQGTVLVRLGGAKDLAPVVAAMQSQRPSTAVADSCSFLGGMISVATNRRRAEAAEEALSKGGDSAWSSLLAAFAHEIAGETLDMNRAMSRAVRMSDSPLTKALFARSLRAIGRSDEADTLKRSIRAELLKIDLRRTPQHPLLGPELAFAFASD
jgi:hypothetical protein